MITDNIEMKKRVSDSILTRLGGGILDVELSPEQLIKCVDLGLSKLKQRSDAFVEESLILLTLQKDQKEYTLPEEVIDVQQIYRKGFGRGSYNISNMDPFAYSYANIYMCGLQGASKVGGLVTYDLNTSYLKTAGKMFGMYMMFSFNPNTHILKLAENPRSDDEIVALHSFVDRPDYMVLQDRFSGIWVENWALAEAKAILGEIRSRFPNLPGPLGTTSQNGNELKNESKAEKELLEKELNNFVTGGFDSEMRVYSG